MISTITIMKLLIVQKRENSRFFTKNMFSILQKSETPILLTKENIKIKLSYGNSNKEER